MDGPDKGTDLDRSLQKPADCLSFPLVSDPEGPARHLYASIAAKKAFSSKRGLFFTVKGPCALPKFHTDHPPSLPAPPHGGAGGVLLKIPKRGGRGRGGGMVSVEFGERARPLYREKKAPFR